MPRSSACRKCWNDWSDDVVHRPDGHNDTILQRYARSKPSARLKQDELDLLSERTGSGSEAHLEEVECLSGHVEGHGKSNFPKTT